MRFEKFKEMQQKICSPKNKSARLEEKYDKMLKEVGIERLEKRYEK